MEQLVEFDFWNIAEQRYYSEIVEKVMQSCFIKEELHGKRLYINVIFTNSARIREINSQYRKIDAETDVLSFPMFERQELQVLQQLEYEDTLGDIIINVEQVKKQAVEYGHSFERELSYMAVHAFYHIIGYDHEIEEDKREMRIKEEEILEDLQITRD